MTPSPPEGIVIHDLADTRLDRLLGSQAHDLRADVELLEGAANPFDLKDYLNGSQTPVFFGSAINNFGVRELLDAFVEMAPAPIPRATADPEVSPYEDAFSGFVFKIQANMNPAHRDRIAFLRICSGRFQRGMRVLHHRIGKALTIANATILDGPGSAQCGGSLSRGYHRHTTTTALSKSAIPSATKNR